MTPGKKFNGVDDAILRGGAKNLVAGFRDGCRIVIMITLVVCLHSAPPSLARTPEQPNIILILADDLGYSDLGCYGGEIRTPNLDQLAAQGIRATQFYNTAKCHTTRASLLTGLHWQQAMQSDKYQLGGSGVTIAEVLNRAGYMTALSGKWHLCSSSTSAQSPLSRGFDRFFGTIKGAGSFYNPASLHRGTAPVEPAADFYYTDAITDEAVDVIGLAAGEGKPLFLYVAYTAPHWPLHALPEDIARYRGVYHEGWDAVRTARHARMVEMGIVSPKWPLSRRDSSDDWNSIPHRAWHERRMEVYAAMVDRMDQGIGRIVNALEDSGQFDNTLIMFMSDNGACSVDVQGRLAANCLGNHLVTRDGRPISTGPVPSVMPGPETTFQAYGATWANVSNTPYRKYKGSSFEGGIRTPFIMHWPRGVSRPGSLVRGIAHVVDILPTCIEVAGAKYPDSFRGRPVPPLEGLGLKRLIDDTVSKPGTVFQQFNRGAAMRYGNWKIVTRQYEVGKWSLWNMTDDATETVDVAGKYPQRLAELTESWRKWAHRVRVRQ